MIYVPDDLPYSACYSLLDNYTMRVFEDIPSVDTNVNYIDVAIDNHYLYREGSTIYHDVLEVPSCISSERITSAWSYRTDFFEILGCIGILLVLLYFVLSRPIKWLFRGWL